MVLGDLLSIIKAKQAEIAKLQAELEEARPRLAAIVRSTSVTSSASPAVIRTCSVFFHSVGAPGKPGGRSEATASPVSVSWVLRGC